MFAVDSYSTMNPFFEMCSTYDVLLISKKRNTGKLSPKFHTMSMNILCIKLYCIRTNKTNVHYTVLYRSVTDSRLYWTVLLGRQMMKCNLHAAIGLVVCVSCSSRLLTCVGRWSQYSYLVFHCCNTIRYAGSAYFNTCVENSLWFTECRLYLLKLLGLVFFACAT